MAKPEQVRLPPIPDELTSQQWDPTTKIQQHPDGKVIVHSVRQNVEGHLDYQSDGSFIYHASTGSYVHFASNNAIYYQKGGITHSVDNNHDNKIAGQHRHNTDTDSHTEVGKNASTVFNGMHDGYSTAHGKFAAADVYHSSFTGSVVVNAARDMEFTSKKGRVTFHSTGVQTHTTDQGDFHVASGGDVDLNGQANGIFNMQQNITMTAQQNISHSAQQNITVTAKQNANVSGQVVNLNKAVTIGGASSLGAGTLNVASGVYLNGSTYQNPDYALEHYFKKEIVKFANNKGAAEYQGLIPLEKLKEYLQQHLRVSGIPDRPTDIFERADIALEKIEELLIYIIQLYERIKELENK